MNNIVTQAKAEFIRAKERIAHALATTPDDKINWAPSLTARTPLHIVAHSAMANSVIQGMFHDKPFPYGSVAEYDATTRRLEKEYTTRAQVLGILEQTSAEYLSWLDSLTPEQVASTVDTFFGSFPMAAGITFAADQMRGHASQIDYLQTIWSDTDWHL